MSTLTRTEIERRLSENENPLRITPILSRRQIGDASVDVRLGNQFIVFRMHKFNAFSAYETPSNKLKQLQQRQIIRYGEEFFLHPGALVLGATFEYIRMPLNLECQVEGRSSWARLGLQIATANSVEPGFTGVVTLELSNVGTIPLKLFPGIRIAQLVFREARPPLKSPYGEKRKYRCPIGPEFSRAFADNDGRVFAEYQNTW